MTCVAGYCRTAGASAECAQAACDGITAPAGCSTFGCAGTCHLYCIGAVAFADAKPACEAWGGYLAEIDTIEENDCTSAMLTGDTWLGLTQAPGQATPDAGWSWLHAGQPLATFTNWTPGQPDDADGIENDEQDCAVMQGPAGTSPGTWNDRACMYAYAYVCEHD
jgi:hypothetical protein